MAFRSNKLVIKNAVLYKKGFTVFCVLYFFYDYYVFSSEVLKCFVVMLRSLVPMPLYQVSDGKNEGVVCYYCCFFVSDFPNPPH